MLLLIILILVAAAITGSLGGVLEIAAGVAIGLFLFVVGMALVGYYVVRYRFRRAAREWERRQRFGPPDRYDRL
jgi:Kef-type K+ transport system membrane component KefB